MPGVSAIKLKKLYVDSNAKDLLKDWCEQLEENNNEVGLLKLDGYALWGDLLLEKASWKYAKKMEDVLDGLYSKKNYFQKLKEDLKEAIVKNFSISEVKFEKMFMFHSKSISRLKKSLDSYIPKFTGKFRFGNRYVLFNALLMKKSEYKRWNEEGTPLGRASSLDVNFTEVFGKDKVKCEKLLKKVKKAEDGTPETNYLKIKVTHGAHMQIKKEQKEISEGGKNLRIDLKKLVLWNNAILPEELYSRIRKNNLYNYMEQYMKGIDEKTKKSLIKELKEKIAKVSKIDSEIS